MLCNITQQIINKQTDTPNSNHKNLSKTTAALQTRRKQYFSMKL